MEEGEWRKGGKEEGEWRKGYRRVKKWPEKEKSNQPDRIPTSTLAVELFNMKKGFRNKTTLLLLLAAIGGIQILNAQTGVTGLSPQQLQPGGDTAKMTWFGDAKLGIFIHWGMYAVNGVDESWSFHNKKISHAEYMKQMKGFTAGRYDPDAWAALF